MKKSNPEPSTAKYEISPASPEEAGLFYAQTPEEDEALGCIGHVRMDFGHGGKEFWHTWHPRGAEELNSDEFKAELGEVVDQLRESVLQDLSTMRSFCYDHGGEIEGGICTQNYGYTVETERYRYLLRCNPIEGDYQAYLTCFDKQAQEDGNIFNLMGIASRTLRRNGLDDRAKEMCDRIHGTDNYYKALDIIGEYVNITSENDGISEIDEPDEGMKMQLGGM